MKQQENIDLENRVQDLKNRIELKRMLSEYTSGVLKPPIYYKDDIIDVDDLHYLNPIDARDEPIRKRIIPRIQEIAGDADDLPLRNIFREHKLSKFDLENNRDDELGRSNNDPRAIQLKYSKINKIPAESGVYTEGGLVLVPDSGVVVSDNERKYNNCIKNFSLKF